MLDCSFGDIAGPVEGKLLDHRPLKLNKDDFERVRRIPYKKVGGSFFSSFCVITPFLSITILSYMF
jgi:hypothetical protein